MTHYVTIQETTEHVYKLDIPPGMAKEDILAEFINFCPKPHLTVWLNLHVVTAVPAEGHHSAQ